MSSKVLLSLLGDRRKVEHYRSTLVQLNQFGSVKCTDSYLSLNSRILSSPSRDIFFDLMVHIEAARIECGTLKLNEADTATLMESFLSCMRDVGAGVMAKPIRVPRPDQRILCCIHSPLFHIVISSPSCCRMISGRSSDVHQFDSIRAQFVRQRGLFRG